MCQQKGWDSEEVGESTRQLLCMRGSKVVAACTFNELQAVGLFLALDSASTRYDLFTSTVS